MSTSSSSPKPFAARRRWLVQFGTRTLFVLIVLAAIAAWWARGEMVKEQRRDEVIGEFAISMNSLHLKDEPPSWPKRLGAWLRGKRPTSVVTGGVIQNIPSAKVLDALVSEFPMAEFEVQLFKPASPEELAALAKCKRLSWFRVPFNPEANDETVARLAAIHATQGIVWNLDRLDDVVLQKIADAKVGIRHLEEDSQVDGGDYQEWANITNEGLQRAATLPKLAQLIGNRRASDQGIAPFRNHPAITQAKLVGPGYTDASAEVLATLPSLTSLVLCDTQLSDAAIARAIAGRKITRLQFDGTPVGKETAEELGKLSSLESFTIRNVPLPPEVIAALLKLPIKRLEIEGDYDDATIASLAPLAPRLSHLAVAAPQATDTSLAWLREAKTLRELHLRDTQITVATIRLIPTFAAIAGLSLGGPNIKASVLEATGPIRSLRNIKLCGPSIDDEAIAALPQSITGATLSGTQVTLNGLKSVRADGDPIWITINYEGTEPPFSEAEIEEIATATNGRVRVGCNGLSHANFRALLPKKVDAERGEQ